MAALNALQKLYFIMDSFGNFYRLNANKELVAAVDKRDACTFSYLEVHERLGSGKRAQFYKAIPADEAERLIDAKSHVQPELQEDEARDIEGKTVTEEDAKVTIQKETVSCVSEGETVKPAMTEKIREPAPESRKKSALCQSIDDLADVDWVELLQNLIYISAMIPEYKERLQADHSKIEQRICDILHYVELYDYEDQDALEMMEHLREAREKRRIIKNEMFRIDRFQNSIGSNANAIRAKDALKQIRGKEAGTYRPRVAPELFEEAQLRPRNLHKCYADRDSMIISHNKRAVVPEEQEEGVFDQMEYEYERAGTVYDDKKVDWLAFVKTQTEFFRNAQQRIIDLQCDLDSIDAAIEEALETIEDANYNVTQGYRAFKELKDLRNERKEVLAELQAVQTIAERFDCESMLEAYEEIERELTADDDQDASDQQAAAAPAAETAQNLEGKETIPETMEMRIQAVS